MCKNTENKIINSIGEKIKQRRTEKGYSLRELGKIVDLSANFLSAVERGINGISIEKLTKVAHALDVPVSYLLSDVDKGINEMENIKVKEIVTDNDVVYEFFLSKHVFPNGLTYEQMCDKIKLLNKLRGK
ncbi:helix-turn-helix transcriptional regulator [Clostridium niameyense]|uniref:Helix-turn-helix transcriptional regulator n=1 Tax=Clostridium niameyense TaxID=1622073 RepID=A0A6M0RDY4_9CLOT|nr:helix-turn-helix transcriptional regulator [Clostridium niameyense]NEZ47839.1 helix-turn-helix transcriptional regulator [Clostridium niameyense]